MRLWKSLGGPTAVGPRSQGPAGPRTEGELERLRQENACLREESGYVSPEQFETHNPVSIRPCP